tara:strand:- start:968 stop:1495 length:528 start_codon:yes stop_codon:yes gene_type:complete
MSAPLMPKATALWLLDNTTLTFQQIGEFCQLHPLEVQALADEETGFGLQPFDPVAAEQLSEENLKAAQEDPDVKLTLLAPHAQSSRAKKKSRYTPLSRRKERPDAIAWLLKYHPDLSDAQIIRIVRTTKATIESIRAGTHKNIEEIKERNPVVLGLCPQETLDEELKSIQRPSKS